MVTRAENGGDAFDAALRRRLSGDALESTPNCLDAELLAAYYERTLDRDTRGRCDAHLADCARCQAALAALARADVAAASASHRWTLAWAAPGWRIAVPALAAGLVLAVAVLRMRGNVGVAPSEELASARMAELRLQQAAKGRAAAPARPAAPPTVGELAMNEAARAQAAGAGRGESAAASAPAAAPAAKAESRAVAPQRMAVAKERTTIREMIASTPAGGASTAGNAVVAQAAPTMPNAPTGAAMGAPPPSPASAGAGAAIGMAAQAPTAGGAATNAPPASGAVVGGMAGSAAAAPQFIVRAPDGVARWHVRIGDQIDYTPNGLDFYGSSTGLAAPLAAGSAPTVNVCWMVGRAGAVIRTTDGTHWTRLSSPTGTDLIGIKAENADTATVTDLNGRTYTTSDGGRTWSSK